MKTTIDAHQQQPPLAHGYTVSVDDDMELDVYVLSRANGTPYLVLVGRPDAMHGWVSWHGYEVWGLMEPDHDDGVYSGPTPETPHETIVQAAVARSLEDDRAKAA